jgi:hypothetical protein
MDDQVQVGRLASVPGVGVLMAIFEKNDLAVYRGPQTDDKGLSGLHRFPRRRVVYERAAI